MIYLDNAATTKPFDDTLKESIDYTYENFYNPSSVYLPAFEVKKYIKEEKQQLKNILGVNEGEIVFTSGATESNNLLLQGILTSNKKEEYIFSLGEHASIYEVANIIKSKGYTVHFAKLTKNGQVDIEHLLSLVNLNTRLVSIIHVSNETGAINDIKTIVKLVKQKNSKTLVHSDGVQAFSKINVNVFDLGLDAYTISGHKIHALKGIGALYIKKGVNIKPIIFGGGQEENLRSGTENVLGILSLVKSATKLQYKLKENYDKVKNLKTLFLNELKTLNNIVLHAQNDTVSPYIISLSILGIKSEILVHMLEKKGVLVSTGSSCSSNKKQAGNRILEAIGCSKEEVLGSIRVSFSEFNEPEEVKTAGKIFKDAVNELLEKIK